MCQKDQQIQQTNDRRQSTISSIFFVKEEHDLARRFLTSTNAQRRLSTISQIYVPHGDEYHGQQRIPPTGPECQQKFLLKRVRESNEPRLSIIPQVYHPYGEDLVAAKTKEHHRRILFIVEPIIIGMILFPIVILFWECGWNIVLILLKSVNGYPLDGSRQFFTQSQKGAQTQRKKWKGLARPSPFFIENHDPLQLNLEEGDFSSQSLVISYVIVQVILLCFYLGQDFFYNFLKRQNYIIEIILLKCHIFLLASIYIVQWEMIWTIWDQYTPHEWYFELLLSLTFLFALIVCIGHLSDLVCAPFLVSYDSIEYCLQFGCPLLTRQMKQWKINLINFVLYEIIISNITMIIWRGFYHFIDKYFYPDDWIRSAWLCLLIGYILYFPLMYFQNYLEDLNLKYEFWTFVSINFPQFYRNIRHLLAFFSCLFLWRGFWLLYDSYINIFELYYQTYVLLYLLSFLFLALIQTASSTNGPLSNMEDENRFFPLYPNCYVSTVVRKFSQLPFFRSATTKQDIKPYA